MVVGHPGASFLLLHGMLVFARVISSGMMDAKRPSINMLACVYIGTCRICLVCKLFLLVSHGCENDTIAKDFSERFCCE